MNVAFSYNNLESSSTLEAYAEQKLKNDIYELSASPMVITIELYSFSKNQYMCLISFQDSQRQFSTSSTGPYVFDCVDRVVDKLKKELEKSPA